MLEVLPTFEIKKSHVLFMISVLQGLADPLELKRKSRMIFQRGRERKETSQLSFPARETIYG